jgi:hypothetical protein
MYAECLGWRRVEVKVPPMGNIIRIGVEFIEVQAQMKQYFSVFKLLNVVHNNGGAQFV